MINMMDTRQAKRMRLENPNDTFRVLKETTIVGAILRLESLDMIFSASRNFKLQVWFPQITS